MVRQITYYPKGTCSAKMVISIDDTNDTIVDFDVMGGCPGNLGGLKRLIIGMNAKEVATKLDGVTCGYKSTSCPDQLSKAISQYYAQKEGK